MARKIRQLSLFLTRISDSLDSTLGAKLMKKMFTFWPWLATVGVAWSLGFFL